MPCAIEFDMAIPIAIFSKKLLTLWWLDLQNGPRFPSFAPCCHVSTANALINVGATKSAYKSKFCLKIKQKNFSDLLYWQFKKQKNVQSIIKFINLLINKMRDTPVWFCPFGGDKCYWKWNPSDTVYPSAPLPLSQ